MNIINISLENSNINIDISKLQFKFTSGKNIVFRGVSNWNKGFHFEDFCTKLEAFIYNKLVGQAGLEPGYENDKPSDFGYIFGVSVNPKYQGQNIGTNIMFEIEKYAKSIKMKRLFLRPANDKVIKFYNKLGYKYYDTDKYGEIMYKDI